MPIEISRLLIVKGHVNIGVHSGIAHETRPEEVDILHDECADERHLLEKRIVAITFGKGLKKVHLDQGVVAIKAIRVGHHVEDWRKFFHALFVEEGMPIFGRGF